MRLLKFADLVAAPWKNGGGVTRELAGYPPISSYDNFAWRISIAEVNKSGAFSIFPGVDRVITLLAGHGMKLRDESGNQVPLSLFEPHSFLGELPIYAELEDGACRDFNLMLRRGAATGTVEVVVDECKFPQGCNLVFCALGSWEVLSDDGESADLQDSESLFWEGRSEGVSVRPLVADSILIAVTINLL